MTIKTCGNHGECEKRRQLRQLAVVLLVIIIVVLLIILIVWLSLRPHKPQFYIQDASVRELNVSSSADLLSAILQVFYMHSFYIQFVICLFIFSSCVSSWPIFL
jgi:hypothetical protein